VLSGCLGISRSWHSDVTDIYRQSQRTSSHGNATSIPFIVCTLCSLHIINMYWKTSNAFVLKEQRFMDSDLTIFAFVSLVFMALYIYTSTSGVRHNIRSPSRLYTCSCALLLCDWLAHATLFWLFWSRCWQLSSHWYQLRWWRSPFYWWSNEMGLRFSKFWGISSRYGSPHKLA